MSIDTVAAVPAFETIRLAALTPKGTAVNACYRFLAALRELGEDDHADVLELLELELGPEREPRDQHA